MKTNLMLVMLFCGCACVAQLTSETKVLIHRKYKATINGTFKVTIDCKQREDTYSGYLREVECGGEITQADGRWVLFDPEKVADRILDRALAPQVQKIATQALRDDAVWRKSHTAVIRP